MATIAELNVRIGAILAPMEKGLLNAEKKLQASGQRLSSIGQDISLSIGLPLAAIGVSAVKAAGDIESLTLALEGQLGSAEKAREELELLRKAALAPGLGFEQAVRGSVQLQAVGLSAEEARRTIEAFGNGLALAGKGGAELDGVITAIGQISSKGKVFAEEINQIAERLPQIRTLMKQAFGTSNTEDIQKLGLSSQEFTAAIVEQLEKLPKATGGIKNAFDNMRDSVNQSLATVGFAINDAFDVTGTLAAFSDTLSGIAKAFDGLSDSTKQFIVIVGGTLIALGPLVKIIGVLVSAKATYVIALEGIKKGLLAVSGAALRAATALTAFAAANPILALTIAVAAFYTAIAVYDNYQKSVRGVTAAQKELNKVNETAEESIVSQRVEAERLTKIIANGNSTLKQQQDALDKLIKIAPDYYGALDRTAISVDAVKAATDKYIGSLRLQAKITAAKDQLEEYEKQLLKVNKNSDPSILQQTGNALLSAGFAGQFAALNAATYSKNLAENKKELEENSAAMAKLIAELEAGIEVSDKIKEPKPPGPTADQIEAAKRRAELYKNAIESINAVSTKGDVLGADLIGEQAGEINNQIERLLENGFKPYSKEILYLQGLIKNLRASIGAVSKDFAIPITQNAPTIATAATPESVTQTVGIAGSEETKKALESLKKATVDTGFSVTDTMAQIRAGTLSAAEGFRILAENSTKTSEEMKAVLDVVEGAISTSFSALGEAVISGGAAYAELAKSVVGSAGEIISAMAKQYVAVLLARSAFFVANPFLAGAVAGAIAALAGGLFKGLVSKIKVPALAEGGITTKPTLAMVGDNPGGREAIIPLNKLPGIIQQSGAGMGAIVAEYILRGQDLLTVLKRAETSNQRLTGAF